MVLLLLFMSIKTQSAKEPIVDDTVFTFLDDDQHR
jgi:hypothetical protein